MSCDVLPQFLSRLRGQQKRNACSYKTTHQEGYKKGLIIFNIQFLFHDVPSFPLTILHQGRDPGRYSGLMTGDVRPDGRSGDLLQ